MLQLPFFFAEPSERDFSGANICRILPQYFSNLLWKRRVILKQRWAIKSEQETLGPVGRYGPSRKASLEASASGNTGLMNYISPKATAVKLVAGSRGVMMKNWNEERPAGASVIRHTAPCSRLHVYLPT